MYPAGDHPAVRDPVESWVMHATGGDMCASNDGGCRRPTATAPARFIGATDRGLTVDEQPHFATPPRRRSSADQVRVPPGRSPV